MFRCVSGKRECFLTCFPPPLDYLRFLPEILLTIFGIATMMLEAVAHGKRTYLGVISLLVSPPPLWPIFAPTPTRAQPSKNARCGWLRSLLPGLLLVAGFLCILSSFSYLEREGAQSGEYYALILFSLVGQCILATAGDLIMVFIGLEISSIATYILAGFLRDDRRNNEAALKYFLLGSFATAFLLYGIAWIYGLTGITNLPQIQQLSQQQPHPSSIAAPGRRAHVRRSRIQGLHRAFPDVGARCLPGRGRACERISCPPGRKLPLSPCSSASS